MNFLFLLLEFSYILKLWIDKTITKNSVIMWLKYKKNKLAFEAPTKTWPLLFH